MKTTQNGIVYPEPEDYANWSGDLQALAASTDTQLATRHSNVTTALTPCRYSINLDAGTYGANNDQPVGTTGGAWYSTNFTSFVETQTAFAPSLYGWFNISVSATFLLTGALTTNAACTLKLQVINPGFAASSNATLPLAQTTFSANDTYGTTWSPVGLELNLDVFVELRQNMYFQLVVNHQNVASNMSTTGILSVSRICPSLV